VKFTVLDNKKNKTTLNIDLDDSQTDKDFFDKNINLYYRYVTSRFRVGKASVKGRSQIICSGAKAYKQKGTGNARRGINSSPLRRGGAVAFGPQLRDYKFSLNKKFIKKIKINMFAQKQDDITVLDKTIKINKTKDAVTLINQNMSDASKVLLISSNMDQEINRPFRNIKNVKIVDYDYLNPEEFMSSSFIILTENSYLKLKGYIDE